MRQRALRPAMGTAPGGGFDPPLVNLGNPEEVTMLDLAGEIIAATESPSRIVFCPLPADDPKIRRPDITRAKQFLGWAPRISRAEGLRRTIVYFEQELDHVRARAMAAQPA